MTLARCSTDAAVTYLLRTKLNKAGSRDGGSAVSAPQSIPRPADASKLKKHLTLVADRLHKGLRPSGGQAGVGGFEATPT